MSATLAEQLLSQRAPWPAPTAAERWAAFVQDQSERDEHKSPATRAAEQLARRRSLVRYGCRRLRVGNERRLLRPLAAVRAETAALLRELGHARLSRVVEGKAEVARRSVPAVQLELGL